MKYFISLIVLPLYLFGYNYQDEPYQQPVEYEAYNSEYAIDYPTIMEENSSIEEYTNEYHEESLVYEEDVVYEENIVSEYLQTAPQNLSINYMELKKARKEAIVENKYVLVKIESNNCPTCTQLNYLLDSNENIKNLFSSHIKAVKLNQSYDKIPPKYQFIGTPTIFIIEPTTGKIQMRLQGTETIKDLETALKEISQTLI